MTTITRRAALGGLALFSAPAAALALPQSTLDAYRESNSAEDRLQRHLLMAAQALDEICPADNCRWHILGGGKPGAHDPWFRVARFDRDRDFSEPRVPAGMDLERMVEIYALTGKRNFWGEEI